MNNMQTALQNPHYKKIWEKVIMNRHPEAKSLVEALEMESNERYCQYMLTDNDNFIVDSDYISKYYHHNNNYEILGTSITLEDIMLILPKNFAFLNLHNSFVKIDAHNSYQPVTGYNTHWQLTKPLHEQTPETWEKIANLID